MQCALAALGSCDFDTGIGYGTSNGVKSERVGIVMNREHHQGSFDIVHVKDNNGHVWDTSS